MKRNKSIIFIGEKCSECQAVITTLQFFGLSVTHVESFEDCVGFLSPVNFDLAFIYAGDDIQSCIETINKNKLGDVKFIVAVKERSSIASCVSFRNGASDCVDIYSDHEETYLRILNAIGKIQTTESQRKVFKIKSFVFDYEAQTLSFPEASIKLTIKESEIMRIICENLEHGVSRKKMVMEVWRQDDYFSLRSMDAYLLKLNKLFRHNDRCVEIRHDYKLIKLVVTEKNM